MEKRKRSLRLAIPSFRRFPDSTGLSIEGARPAVREGCRCEIIYASIWPPEGVSWSGGFCGIIKYYRRHLLRMMIRLILSVFLERNYRHSF